MGAAGGRFLVMGMSGLVLKDLLGTMQAYFPLLAAGTAKTEAEAIDLISTSSSWKYAFLHLSPRMFAASELSTLFGKLGTRVVLLGDAAEDAAHTSSVPVLMRPYMPDDVIRLIDATSDV